MIKKSPYLHDNKIKYRIFMHVEFSILLKTNFRVDLSIYIPTYDCIYIFLLIDTGVEFHYSMLEILMEK